MRRLIKSVAAAAFLLASVVSAVAAEPLRVVAFAGASNLPFWAGQEHGLFTRHGVEVSLEITPNSIDFY